MQNNKRNTFDQNRTIKKTKEHQIDRQRDVMEVSRSYQQALLSVYQNDRCQAPRPAMKACLWTDHYYQQDTE